MEGRIFVCAYFLTSFPVVFHPNFAPIFLVIFYVIGWGKASNRNKTLHLLSLSKQAALEERHLFCTITAESSDRWSFGNTSSSGLHGPYLTTSARSSALMLTFRRFAGSVGYFPRDESQTLISLSGCSPVHWSTPTCPIACFVSLVMQWSETSPWVASLALACDVSPVISHSAAFSDVDSAVSALPWWTFADSTLLLSGSSFRTRRFCFSCKWKRIFKCFSYLVTNVAMTG